MFESLKEQTRQFRQELSVIPQPSIEDSPSLEVSKRICSFHKDLDRTISGVDVSGRKIAGGEQSFVQQNRSTYFSFKKAIRSTAPIFQPIAIGNPSERDDAEEVFNEERRVLDPGITLPGPPSTKDFTLARDYIEGYYSSVFPTFAYTDCMTQVERLGERKCHTLYREAGAGRRICRVVEAANDAMLR